MVLQKIIVWMQKNRDFKEEICGTDIVSELYNLEICLTERSHEEEHIPRELREANVL